MPGRAFFSPTSEVGPAAIQVSTSGHIWLRGACTMVELSCVRQWEWDHFVGELCVSALHLHWRCSPHTSALRGVINGMN